MNTHHVTGPGVTAVVVSYHPDADTLTTLLAALQAQVHRVIVVDNASPVLPPLPAGVQRIQLEQNVGVGAAQNIGAQAAWDAGAQFVLLLDQDSVPQPGMVAALQAGLQAAAAAGLRPAAAGPLIVDVDGRSEGFVRFDRSRYETTPTGDAPWQRCDLLIASGTLIQAAAWHAVGGMAERLFIDKVDTEWCLRAAAAGYALVGAPQARLQHRLGITRQRVWFFGWRELAVHKPFRYYYMLRNGLLLRRLPHATQAWRRADARQLLSLLLFFGLLAPGRLMALRMMLRGLRDGLRGIDGPLRLDDGHSSRA